MKILKFGGTSIGSVNRLKSVLSIIKNAAAQNQIIVVVSALEGVTNLLISCTKLARVGDSTWMANVEQIRKQHQFFIEQLVAQQYRTTLQQQIDHKVNSLYLWLGQLMESNYSISEILDRILSLGEQLSASIIVGALNTIGVKAFPVNAVELICTNENFGEAEVNFQISNRQIVNKFSEFPTNEIPIVTGFIGATPEGKITTLGRNGSDYTATILGAALDAELVEFWTDVDGILTADPALVSDAVTLKSISYSEASTIANFRTNVLHPKTIQPLERKRIPAVIKNTLYPDGEGTIISSQSVYRDNDIQTVSLVRNTALLEIKTTGNNTDELSKKITDRLWELNIPIYMVSPVTDTGSFNIAMNLHQISQVSEILRNEFSSFSEFGPVSELQIHKNVSVIALVGNDLHLLHEISERAIRGLAENDFKVLGHSNGYSHHTASLALSNDQSLEALSFIHNTLVLPRNRIDLAISGVSGKVGQAFLKLLRIKKNWITKELGLDIRIVGANNTRKMIWNNDGFTPDQVLNQLDRGLENDWSEFYQYLKSHSVFPLIFVDSTASQSIAQGYHSLLDSGISVVTPNKIANTLKFSYYKTLRQITRLKKLEYRYETTVGAATPFIKSAKDLIESGDKILRIVGILSGTLSFVFSQLNAGKSFSTAVREAMKLGYTEPHPAIDLSGEDMVRKLLILIREVGYEMELQQIFVESLIPEKLKGISDPEKFVDSLTNYDQDWKVKVQNARKKGNHLVYLASFDGKSAQVKIEEVSENAPVAGVRGTENVVSFYSERFSEIPLTIKGPGAGPEFTATGVLDDVIKAALSLSRKNKKGTMPDDDFDVHYSDKLSGSLIDAFTDQ